MVAYIKVKYLRYLFLFTIFIFNVPSIQMLLTFFFVKVEKFCAHIDDAYISYPLNHVTYYNTNSLSTIKRNGSIKLMHSNSCFRRIHFDEIRKMAFFVNNFINVYFLKKIKKILKMFSFA